MTDNGNPASERSKELMMAALDDEISSSERQELERLLLEVFVADGPPRGFACFLRPIPCPV